MEMWIKGTAGTTGDCLYHHLETKQCQTHKTCLKCQGQYTVIKGKIHRCGYAKCSLWKQELRLPHWTSIFLVHARGGKSRLIWYGWRKEPWTKGAAGTGSVDQQAVERHW